MWTVGGDVEELSTETVATSQEWLLQSGVWHCYGIGNAALG